MGGASTLGVMNRRSTWITVALMTAVVGLAGCAATSPSATTPSASSPAGHGIPGGEGGSGSNARSGAAAGGSAGTIDAVSAPGFTMTTPAGEQVTVTEASSTTYAKGTSSAPASAGDIAPGETVLVLGLTTGTTITATQVILQPVDAAEPATYTASAAVPFTQGAPSAANADGQIPTDYTEGDGTIVSGTAADSATTAALAAYPGGVVDRVVQLADGEYEVHYIGVNWPHHIFVDDGFEVVGAN
jgi:hypothetical protein